jgi:hypothetical protein
MKAPPTEGSVSRKISILYDPQDGRVVHTHTVLTTPGGQDVTDEELEERTRQRAERVGHAISGLRTLRVSSDECDASSQYRVNLATGKLEKVERPPR